MYKLILASQSPRRKELLEKAGYSFSIGSVDLSENINKNMSLDEALQDLALQKAEAYVSAHNHLKSQDILVLSADTVVVDQDLVLGKPKDQNQAFEYLSSLSGREHSVKSAFCLLNLKNGQKRSMTVTSQVWFRDLEDQEIWDYVKTGEPMDKAGAYAIQGLGRKLVERFEGSWDNIVGLPVAEVTNVLKEEGWSIG